MGVCTDFYFSLSLSERKIQQEGTQAHLFSALSDETLKESSLRYLWYSAHQISPKNQAWRCLTALFGINFRREGWEKSLFLLSAVCFSPAVVVKLNAAGFDAPPQNRVLKADPFHLQGAFCSTSAAKWLSSWEATGTSVVCVQMLSLSALSQDHFQIKREF